MDETKNEALTPPPQAVPLAQLMSQAAQALAEGEYARVTELCEQALALDAQNEHAWYLKAAAAEGEGKAEQAVECLDHVRSAPDLQPRATLLRGRLLFFLDRLDEAEQELAQATRLAPEQELSYYLRGLLGLRRQRIIEAHKLFKQAVRLNPEFGPAQYELGILALQQGELAIALDHCAKAATLLPEMPEAHNNLGLARQASGDTAGAEAAFRRAVELQEDYAEAWANLALLLRTGDEAQRAESARCLVKALALKPALKDLLPAEVLG